MHELDMGELTDKEGRRTKLFSGFVASTSLSFLIGELAHVLLEGDVHLVVEPDEFS